MDIPSFSSQSEPAKITTHWFVYIKYQHSFQTNSFPLSRPQPTSSFKFHVLCIFSSCDRTFFSRLIFLWCFGVDTFPLLFFCCWSLLTNYTKWAIPGHGKQNMSFCMNNNFEMIFKQKFQYKRQLARPRCHSFVNQQCTSEELIIR